MESLLTGSIMHPFVLFYWSLNSFGPLTSSATLHLVPDSEKIIDGICNTVTIYRHFVSAIAEV